MINRKQICVVNDESKKGNIPMALCSSCPFYYNLVKTVQWLDKVLLSFFMSHFIFNCHSHNTHTSYFINSMIIFQHSSLMTTENNAKLDAALYWVNYKLCHVQTGTLRIHTVSLSHTHTQTYTHLYIHVCSTYTFRTTHGTHRHLYFPYYMTIGTDIKSGI